jgi:hypothetical protein
MKRILFLVFTFFVFSQTTLAHGTFAFDDLKPILNQKPMLAKFLYSTLDFDEGGIASRIRETNDKTNTSAGISQLVETRNGKASCFGVVVHLSNMTFKRSIVASQIRIVEAKHGHDLTDIMVWSVGKKGKRLTIRFKENAGDFGTGNVVQIDIDRSAFLGPIESGDLKFMWAITTDHM